MRTLVIHAGAIGDFIVACPAIAQLSRLGAVTLAGYPERHALAVEAGIAERAVSLESFDFHTIFDAPSERFKAFVAQFECAVLWMRDHGGMARALRGAGVRELICAPGLPGADWQRAAADYYLHSIGAPEGGAPCLAFTPAPSEYDAFIHPGSGSAKKNWPLEHFGEIANRLAQRGLRIGWIIGPAENGMELPPGAARVEENSLPALARMLAGAKLHVGNDSGITHLAAAVGCPAVAVFGPSDARVWVPRGDKVRVCPAAQAGQWPETSQVHAACVALLEGSSA